MLKHKPGNSKGGSITAVPLTSCLTGLNDSVLQIKTKIVSCRTAGSKPVKQEVNGTVILPPLVFPAQNVVQIKTKIVSCRTADSKPVKREVNGTVILPPLVFPA